MTLVELSSQLLAPLDPEMARPLGHELINNGVTLELGHAVTRIDDGWAQLDDGRRVPTDLVVFAIGVRPDSTLATAAGLEVGLSGDPRRRSSAHERPHIWAVGDLVEVRLRRWHGNADTAGQHRESSGPSSR